MATRLKAVLPLTLSIGLLAFLASEVALNFTFHWVTVQDGVFGKYGLHLPLNRQSTCFAREGIDLDVSTLADWVGAVAASLQPLTKAIEAHVRAAARIHADETPVPVLAKGTTREGRLWTIVRDDRPFGGPQLEGTGPPAAVFFYSPDRSGVHAG